MPSYFPEGNEPLPMDNEMRSLQKINAAFSGSGGGGGGVAPSLKEIYRGNGDPTGIFIPIMTDALYFQDDSVPAGLAWTWSSGTWHAPIT